MYPQVQPLAGAWGTPAISYPFWLLLIRKVFIVAVKSKAKLGGHQQALVGNKSYVVENITLLVYFSGTKMDAWWA